MKLGGICPLNKNKSPEIFMKHELGKFIKSEQLLRIDPNELKGHFCVKVCKNMIC